MREGGGKGRKEGRKGWREKSERKVVVKKECGTTTILLYS